MRKDFVRVMTGVLSVGLALGVLPNQMYAEEYINTQEIEQEVLTESIATSVSPEVRYTNIFYNGDYNYTILSQEDKTVEINMCFAGKESESELYIPQEVEFDGEIYTVTSIGRSAFSGCDKLIGNLIIPNTITDIGENAFRGCVGLTGDLIIPDSVTSIGNYAFEQCEQLTGELIIPDSITAIGTGVFAGCDSLKAIVINADIENIEGYAFPEYQSLDSIKINYGALDITDKGYKEWEKFVIERMGLRANRVESGYIYNSTETKQVKGTGIEIPDTQQPTWIYTGNSHITIEEGGTFILPEVTAVDNKGESVEVTCIIKNSSNEIIPTIDTIGRYTIIYYAVDAQGNEATPFVISVIVRAAVEGIQFKDPIFKQALIANGVDKNNDGKITIAEMQQVTELNISGKQISDISEIEYATHLEYLDLSHNRIKDISLLPIKKYSSLRLEDNDLDIKENSQSMQIIKQIEALGSQVVYTPQRGSISSNANLNTLTVSEGSLSPVFSLSPAFNKETTVYAVTVGYGTQNITIEGTAEDQKASLEGLGNKVLQVGQNTIQIVVTAEDQTTKTYTLVITRAAAYPTGGIVSGGGLDDVEEPTIEKVLESVEVKEAVMDDFKVHMPYTSLKTGVTLEQLKKLTNNKLTDKQLQELVKKPELLKKLGIEESMLSNQIALKPVESVTFTDVSQKHWASDSIKLAAELGLVEGMPNNKFEPKASLQVADTFAFLDRALLLNDVTEMKLSRTTVEKYITDKEHWAFAHVASVASKLSEETLKVMSELGEKPIQRQLLAQVLYEITENKIEANREGILFEDIEASPYKEAINYCTQVGLLNGVDSTHMAPEKELTRAELISILIRLNELLK